MESRALRAADGIVTLTDALWQAMQDWPALDGRRVAHETIPCCIDLEKFRFDERQRGAVRSKLGITNRFVLVYSGSVGGWYMTDEMAAFFRALKQREPRAFFLWLTPGDVSIVNDAMKRHGIELTDYSVKKVEPPAIPEFLSAADAGIAFYRPGTSRLGTSPVKVSEYFACGLAVVVNSGIGDCDRLFEGTNVGIPIREFTEAAYRDAVSSLLTFGENQDESRRRSREVAERFFDLKNVGALRYARLYEQVFAS